MIKESENQVNFKSLIKEILTYEVCNFFIYIKTLHFVKKRTLLSNLLAYSLFKSTKIFFIV